MARLPLVVLAVLMVVGVHASPPTIQDYLMDSSIQTGGKPTSYNSGYGVNKLCLAEVQLDQCGFYSGSTSLFQLSAFTAAAGATGDTQQQPVAGSRHSDGTACIHPQFAPESVLLTCWSAQTPTWRLARSSCSN